jgi:hypothetical protein
VNISASVLYAGIIFGIIGMIIFKEAKKRSSSGMYFVGLALMLYPYAIEDDILVWVIGVALTAYAFSFMRD